VAAIVAQLNVIVVLFRRKLVVKIWEGLSLRPAEEEKTMSRNSFNNTW